jgi:hypothetical protein
MRRPIATSAVLVVAACTALAACGSSGGSGTGSGAGTAGSKTACLWVARLTGKQYSVVPGTPICAPTLKFTS